LKKKLFMVISLITLLASQAAMSAVTTTTVNKQTNTMELSLQYPQGFADPAINAIISDFVALNRQELNTVIQADKGPASLPGKNSLNISYQIMFENSKVISLLMTVITNQRGAAHPVSHVKTFNFISGQQVTLNQILLENTLKTIADLSKAALSKKGITESDWVAKGTSPSEDNYKNWYFTPQGIAIVFDTYQVAAYVYGAQTVLIPLNMVQSWIRPEIAQAVWGSS